MATSKKSYRAVVGLYLVDGASTLDVPAGAITDRVPAADAKWMYEQGWIIDADAQWPPEEEPPWLRQILGLDDDAPLPGTETAPEVTKGELPKDEPTDDAETQEV